MRIYIKHVTRYLPYPCFSPNFVVFPPFGVDPLCCGQYIPKTPGK